MLATFKSPLFAILESAVPQLLHAEKRIAGPVSANGIIPVTGVLGLNDWFADTDYSVIQRSIQAALDNPAVREITLYVDSPGGSVLGLPETADAIYAANRKKPVNAVVTGIAASAAYWLASQAGTIRMHPSAEMGSIGVLDLSVDVTKALDSAGIKVTPIQSAPFKTERAAFVPLTDAAKAHAQKTVDYWHQQFVSAIRRGRGDRVSADNHFGDGRMLMAHEALQQDMVDFVSIRKIA